MDDSTIEDTVYRDFVNFVARSVWVSSPEYAGWLTKRSSNWFMNNSLLFRHRAWQPKWVSLHGSELVYMDKEPIMDGNAEDLKIRRAQINGSTVISSDDETNDPAGFVVAFNIESMPNWHFRASSPEEKTNWMIKLSQVHAIISWLEQYERVKVLGIGGQGIVYELKHKSSGERCALKEIEIKSDKQMNLAIAESQFLKKIVETVSHPNIMQIHKVFQVGSKFYLVFPLCTGGELYEAIVERGVFTEYDAARIVKELVGALDALHSHDILHLDIKPENVLFENPDHNSKILLTDFGLSKLFSEVCKDQDSVFDAPENANKTYEEIVETKLSKFMESGDLNTDHLRGTYGYMSPELILTNTYSKATDVFAAGVVLYIILCGYPPFYSKSNRQTFVRTVKGIYKLEGNDWDMISVEAKDLVQRMLEKDPRKRISTKDILNHPWIKCIDVEETTTSLPAAVDAQSTETTAPPAAPASLPAVDPMAMLSTQMRRSSLKGSLSQLATHVQASKSEKIASTVTKLASQVGTASQSRLAELYLKHKLGFTRVASVGSTASSNDDASTNNDESTISIEHQLIMVNPESRKALSKAILTVFGTDSSKLSYEQILQVRKYFGLAASSTTTSAEQMLEITASPPAKGSSKKDTGANKDLSFVNIGDMLLVRMLDRNNDGFITSEDIVTMQVLIMQKHEQVLQAIFRVYVEAVWYPGKNINMIHAMQLASNVNPNLVKDSDESGGISPNPEEKEKVNIIEPPRFITGKNVAAIFEKYGYSSSDGYKVFDILCDTLQHLKHGRKPPDISRIDEETGINSSIPEGLHEEDEDDDDDEAALAAQESAISLNAEALSKDVINPGSPEHIHRNPSSSSGKDGGLLDKFAKHSQAFAKFRQKTLFMSSSQASNKRMDVNDFIRISRFDDVLIQVLFRKTQETFYHFLQYCERKYQIAAMQHQTTTLDLESIILEELKAHPKSCFIPQTLPPFLNQQP